MRARVGPLGGRVKRIEVEAKQQGGRVFGNLRANRRDHKSRVNYSCANGAQVLPSATTVCVRSHLGNLSEPLGVCVCVCVSCGDTADSVGRDEGDPVLLQLPLGST